MHNTVTVVYTLINAGLETLQELPAMKGPALIATKMSPSIKSSFWTMSPSRPPSDQCIQVLLSSQFLHTSMKIRLHTKLHLIGNSVFTNT